jgi:hypothetical protein
MGVWALVIAAALSAAPTARAVERSAPQAAPREEAPALPPPPAILARVGQSILTTRDLEDALDPRSRALLEGRRAAIEKGAWTEAEERRLARVLPGLARRARRRALHETVAVETARASGYSPDEAEVEARLEQAARRAGGADKLARAEGSSLAEIRSDLRRQYLELRFYRNHVAHAVAPSPAEIRAYYEAHRDEMRLPTMVRLRKVTISGERGADSARRLAEKIRKEAEARPESFAELARRHSDDGESAPRGGLLVAGGTEWLPLDLMQGGLGEIARSLSEGEVSRVIETPDGFHLVKLDGLRPQGELSLAEAADRIGEALRRRTEEEIRADWMDFYLRRIYLADGEGREMSPDSFLAGAAGTSRSP